MTEAKRVQTQPLPAGFLEKVPSRRFGATTTCVKCGGIVGFVTQNRAPGEIPQHLDCSPEAIARDDTWSDELSRKREEEWKEFLREHGGELGLQSVE